jgi:hypothetical protein
MLEVRDELTTAIDAELARLQEVWDQDLPAFNELAREQDVAVILPPVDKE